MTRRIHCLECSKTGVRYPPDQLYNLSPDAAAPLLARYRLEALELDRDKIRGRVPSMWRYREVLPDAEAEEIVSLGEGWTPLLRLNNLGERSGLPHLYMKNEAHNPTGSFKDRGLSAAVTMARRLGAKRLAIPTAGNAGGALAAYGARAGLEVFVFMPRDTPRTNLQECLLAGARVALVDGLISDAAREMAKAGKEQDWFDVSTLKEPYRIEGKKTLGYELAEQFGWSLPDVILYPTGGGTGLIGMWKAFQEMEELGWTTNHRPRMVAVQSAGCAPIVKAFEEGRKESDYWPDAHTLASGIRVPKALGDFLILDYIRESDGCAVSVTDQEIREALLEVGTREGILMCPEGAACWAALKQLTARGWAAAGDRIVIFNTASGHKYPEIQAGLYNGTSLHDGVPDSARITPPR